jgi:hypothetical protein
MKRKLIENSDLSYKDVAFFSPILDSPSFPEKKQKRLFCFAEGMEGISHEWNCIIELINEKKVN